jgi:hypothetical protein
VEWKEEPKAPRAGVAWCALGGGRGDGVRDMSGKKCEKNSKIDPKTAPAKEKTNTVKPPANKNKNTNTPQKNAKQKQNQQRKKTAKSLRAQGCRVTFTDFLRSIFISTSAKNGEV